MEPVTSVPRWDTEPAELDPAARSLCLVGLGSAGAELVSRWQAAADVPCSVLLADQLEPELTARFAAQLSAARVGWRLMLAGPEAEVAQLRAQAVAAGAEEAEIRMSVTCSIELSARRRTYCVHCAQIGEFAVAFGGTVRCAGCARELRIRPHFSPRLAAYLGVADAG